MCLDKRGRALLAGVLFGGRVFRFFAPFFWVFLWDETCFRGPFATPYDVRERSCMNSRPNHKVDMLVADHGLEYQTPQMLHRNPSLQCIGISLHGLCIYELSVNQDQKHGRWKFFFSIQSCIRSPNYAFESASISGFLNQGAVWNTSPSFFYPIVSVLRPFEQNRSGLHTHQMQVSLVEFPKSSPCCVKGPLFATS